MRVFLKWLLPEGRLNSGGSGEKGERWGSGIKGREIKREGRIRKETTGEGKDVAER